MRMIKGIISFCVPFTLLIVFASILTTKPYLLVSEGKYAYHDKIEFDYDYAADRIMGYLNYRYDTLQYQFEDGTDAFRQTEIDHMVDVKNLYTNLRIAAGISLILAVILSVNLYRRDQKEFWLTYKNMFIGPMFFVMFVGGYVLIDFGTAFTVFHKIFFTNDDWILYSTDTLILILPSNFWMVSGLIILSLFSLSIFGIYRYSSKMLHKL